MIRAPPCARTVHFGDEVYAKRPGNVHFGDDVHVRAAPGVSLR
jgi:hypothetical protein